MSIFIQTVPQSATPTTYEQWLPFLPLAGVVIGAIIALAGTIIATALNNRAVKKQWQRENRLDYLKDRQAMFSELLFQVSAEPLLDLSNISTVMVQLIPEYATFESYFSDEFRTKIPTQTDWIMRTSFFAQKPTTVNPTTGTPTIDDEEANEIFAFQEVLIDGLAKIIGEADEEINRLTNQRNTPKRWGSQGFRSV